MNIKLKKWITACISIGIIAFVSGYFVWNKPHADIKDAESIAITAVDLYKNFKSDPAKADDLLLNKIVVVAGNISSVSINQNNQKVIFLKTSTEGAFVNCTMEENINNFKTGGDISLKGKCSGYISGDADMGLPGDVFLIRCYLAKSDHKQ